MHGAPRMSAIPSGPFWPFLSNFGNIFYRTPPNVMLMTKSVGQELFYGSEDQNLCQKVMYHNSCLGRLAHFGPYLENFKNCRSNF